MLGHKVILCEAAGVLGGQFILAGESPRKGEFKQATVDCARRLTRLGVEVRLNAPVDAALIESVKPDAVIIATGRHTAEQFASAAKENGFGAIIAAAGKAAHLAGVLAAYTTLPVIGVPIKTSLMGGLDSLLSMVQMPKGIPVACVAVDGADNAAILSAQMLALSDSDLADRLTRFKSDMAQEVAQKDQKMQREEF